MDKYDIAIDHLKMHPYHIEDCWNDCSNPTLIGSCLFQFTDRHHTAYYSKIGCLIQIRNGNKIAQTPELTDKINQDERLPKNIEEITPNDLNVFAEWQRILDKHPTNIHLNKES